MKQHQEFFLKPMILAGVFFLFSFSAILGQTVDFKVTNNSLWAIEEVYFASAGTEEWDANALSDFSKIEGNSTHTFSLACGTYDIKLIDEDGDICLFSNYEVPCNGSGEMLLTNELLLTCQMENDGSEVASGDETRQWAFFQKDGHDSEITVTNSTDNDIYYLYISPVSSETWGDDILGDEVLNAGSSMTFYLNCGDYDIKVVSENDHECIINEREICNEDNTLEFDSESWLDCVLGGDDSDEKWVSRTQDNYSSYVMFKNELGQDLVALYISPSTSDTWGANIAYGNTVAAGEEVKFYLDCDEYDIKYVTEDMTECFDFGVEICEDNYAVTQETYEDCTSDDEWEGDVSSDWENEPYWATRDEDNEFDSYFILDNLADWEIQYLYISPEDGEWGRDVLGEYDILAAGDEMKFYLDCGAYNIKILDENSNECIYYGQELCSENGEMRWEMTNEQFISCRKGGEELTGEVWAATEKKFRYNSYFVVENTSDWDIEYIYVSPEEDNWGDDVLGTHDILRTGEKIKIYLKCGTYNVKLVDEDSDVCIQENLELCSKDEEYVMFIDDDWLLECQGYYEEEEGESGGSDDIWCTTDAENDYDSYLIVKNSSDWTISTLFISPSWSDYWGMDVIEVSEPIPAGEEVKLYLNCDDYDIKVGDNEDNICMFFGNSFCSDDSEAVWELTDEDIEECDSGDSDFDFDFGGDEESAETWATVNETNEYDSQVVFKNSTPFDISYIYISPEEDEWGGDVLGDYEVFEAHSERDVYLNCNTYRIKLIDENDAECEIAARELCQSSSPVFELTMEMYRNCFKTDDYQQWAALTDAGQYNDSFTLKNTTDIEIAALYVSPTDAENWGANILNSNMQGNTSLTLYHNCGRYDIKVILMDGRTCSSFDEELCGNTFTITEEMLSECY